MRHIEQYILCLDTDQYAGNFERATTAYATGIIGDCGVGTEEAEEFIKSEVPEGIKQEIAAKVSQKDPEHEGCFRPCSAQPTPGWVNDGHGTHYRRDKTPPTPEEIETYRESQRKYELPHLLNAREYTAKGVANWTQEGLDRVEQQYLDIDNSVPNWWPAYMSIGIYLAEPLSEAALKVVVSRTKEYLSQPSKYVPGSAKATLEGVRLITNYSESTSELLNIEV